MVQIVVRQCRIGAMILTFHYSPGESLCICLTTVRIVLLQLFRVIHSLYGAFELLRSRT